mgnify:CR=1 FL=1
MNDISGMVSSAHLVELLNRILTWGLIIMTVLLTARLVSLKRVSRVMAWAFYIGITAFYVVARCLAAHTVAVDTSGWSGMIGMILLGLLIAFLIVILCSIFSSATTYTFIWLIAHENVLLERMKYIRAADGSVVLDEKGKPMENDLTKFTFSQTLRLVIPVLSWIGVVVAFFLLLRMVAGFLLIPKFGPCVLRW